ncbi:unnamed protein product, partial [Trichogramma brassicae]
AQASARPIPHRQLFPSVKTLRVPLPESVSFFLFSSARVYPWSLLLRPRSYGREGREGKTISSRSGGKKRGACSSSGSSNASCTSFVPTGGGLKSRKNYLDGCTMRSYRNKYAIQQAKAAVPSSWISVARERDCYFAETYYMERSSCDFGSVRKVQTRVFENPILSSYNTVCVYILHDDHYARLVFSCSQFLKICEISRVIFLILHERMLDHALSESKGEKSSSTNSSSSSSKKKKRKESSPRKFKQTAERFGHAPLSTNATTTITNNSLLSVRRRSLHSIHLYARTADIECMFVCGIYVCVEDASLSKHTQTHMPRALKLRVLRLQRSLHLFSLREAANLLTINKFIDVYLHCNYRVREHNVERIVLSNEKEDSSWSVVQAAQAKMHIRDVGIQVWLLPRNELPPINLHCRVCMTSQMQSNIGTCVSLLLFVSTAACVLEDLQTRDNERREKKRKESGNNRYHDTNQLTLNKRRRLTYTITGLYPMNIAVQRSTSRSHHPFANLLYKGEQALFYRKNISGFVRSVCFAGSRSPAAAGALRISDMQREMRADRYADCKFNSNIRLFYIATFKCGASPARAVPRISGECDESLAHKAHRITAELRALYISLIYVCVFHRIVERVTADVTTNARRGGCVSGLKRNLFFRSTDISCASSACGSPPKQVIKNSIGSSSSSSSSSKRAMRSLRRSMCMIKEQEKLDMADNDDDKESVAESNYDDANEEKKNDEITSADANADEATLDDTETESLYSLSNVVVKDFPEKLGLMRRRSMRSPVRHSEPGALLRTSLIPQTTTTSSRRSVASSVKSTNTAISDSSETKIGSILKAPTKISRGQDLCKAAHGSLHFHALSCIAFTLVVKCAGWLLRGGKGDGGSGATSPNSKAANLTHSSQSLKDVRYQLSNVLFNNSTDWGMAAAGRSELQQRAERERARDDGDDIDYAPLRACTSSSSSVETLFEKFPQLFDGDIRFPTLDSKKPEHRRDYFQATSLPRSESACSASILIKLRKKCEKRETFESEKGCQRKLL